jgi:hypothetical protein
MATKKIRPPLIRARFNIGISPEGDVGFVSVGVVEVVVEVELLGDVVVESVVVVVIASVVVVVVVSAVTATWTSRLVPTIPSFPAAQTRTVQDPSVKGVSVKDTVTWSAVGFRSDASPSSTAFCTAKEN